MKQLIVMVSTIILGIAIAVIVMSFSSQADSIAGSVNGRISDIIIEYEGSSIVN
jgi:hypothetical protein